MAKAQFGWIHFHFTFFEWTGNVKRKKNDWMNGIWYVTFLLNISSSNCFDPVPSAELKNEFERKFRYTGSHCPGLYVSVFRSSSLKSIAINRLLLCYFFFFFSLIYAISGWESFMIEFLWNNSIVLNSKPSFWCMSNVR